MHFAAQFREVASGSNDARMGTPRQMMMGLTLAESVKLIKYD